MTVAFQSPTLVAVLVAAAVVGPTRVTAQQAIAPIQTLPETGSESGSESELEHQDILVLDQEGFFTGTLFGKRSLAEAETAATALAEQNRTIETNLELEELSLTEARVTMEPEAFRQLADAFDEKVQAIRRAQDSKSREIAQGLERARLEFLQLSVPVLSQVVKNHAALVILDRRTVFLSVDRIDITAEASALFDAMVGDGSDGPTEPSDTQK